VIQDRADDLSGILNGADYGEWNPETDSRIAANYSERDREGKSLCKRDLQHTLGLPAAEPGMPLLGVVSRLVSQKGIDLISGAARGMLGLDVQVAVLGAGEPWAEAFCRNLARECPGRFACRIGYDGTLAHKIIAGADFFVMPSRFEPCGLTQMYAMRYGTVPVVRATGGLKDTVENFNETTLAGTGFVFGDATEGALLDTVAWATRTFRSRPDAMDALIRNAMAKRFTWASAADRYEGLYRKAIERRNSVRVVTDG
jgi:starch synthase